MVINILMDGILCGVEIVFEIVIVLFFDFVICLGVIGFSCVGKIVFIMLLVVNLMNRGCMF